MELEKRNSVIDILSDVPWGTHFCQFYQTKEDLTSILVPYFKAGLLNNEFCMWVTAEPLGVEEARNAMRDALPDFDEHSNKGQIEIIPYSDWYLKDGDFDHERVIGGWIDKFEIALKKGFVGLRLTGNTFWLERKDWNTFTDYEMEVTNVIGSYNMIALCTYSLEKCGVREIIDVMKNHQFALIRNEGQWELIENKNQKRMASALKEREESLLNIEARFHGIFDNAIEGISLTTKDGHFIAVNSALAGMFGYGSPEELITKSPDVRALYTKPNRRDEFIKIMESKGLVTGFENQAKTRNGGSIWVLINSRPFTDVNGQIVGYESFYNNITERKLAEEALHEREERLQLAQTNANIGVWDWYSRTGQLVSTPELEGLYDLPPGSLRTYQDWRQRVHPEDIARIEGKRDEAIAKHEPFNMEFRILRDSGQVRWINAKGKATYDEAGEAIRVTGINIDITDRKKIEAELAEAHSDLNRAQAVAMTGSWRLDTCKNVLLWSDETHRMFGIPKGTLLTYDTFLGCIHPDDRDLVDNKWKEALRGALYDIDHRIIVDGVLKWVREKAELEFDKSGNLTGGFGTVQDVTRLKEMSDKIANYAKNLENLVQERTDKMVAASRYARGLIEAGLDPLVTINLEGKITDVNEATIEITGVSRTELIGSDFSDYFTEPEKAREGYKTVFVKGFVKDYPLVIRHKSGKTTHVSYNATTYKNEEGEIQGVFADARDVTELRQADQQIRRQAMLLDNAKEAITLRDLDNRILYWNKGSETLYGWKASEVIGRLAHEIIFKGAHHVDSIPQYTHALNNVIEKGEWNGEMIHKGRHGKEIIVDSRWTIVNDESRMPESILVINMDITDKKRMEGQFLRAQRMESIGTLAGGIAHDLNNILTPIMLSMDFFRTNLKGTESQQMLAMVETNVKRAADMTKQILSFARGVEGEHQPVQVSRLITEVESTIKDTFPKSIEIRTEPLADLGSITGDITQLHQVLMNLCLNARDAMPYGGTLQISAETFFIDENYTRMNVGAKMGQHVVITVTDTGTGMPRSIMDRLFEPFFTTKKQGEGTGLGLSTARGIVKSHGGFIHVYSEVGKGSTFKIYLPSSTITREDVVVQSRMKNFQGHGELILVVDDEEMIRTITKTALKGNGYKVLVASDGAEAVAVYAQHVEEIKVILLDMMMPVMDGHACIRALKKINPEAKVIGVSGLGQNGKHPDIVGKAGAFLVKPFTTEKLLLTIHVVLSVK